MSLNILSKAAFVTLLVSVLLAGAIAQTTVKTGIEKMREQAQHGQRISIAITKFFPTKADIREAEVAREIQDTVRQDLLFTRFFNPVDTGMGFKGRKDDFEYWRTKLVVDFLLTATVSANDSGCQLIAKLYDVQSESVIFDKLFVSSKENYRSVAHELNDLIVQTFAGEKGIAHTKILFTNNSSGFKEIYVIDYDGYNLRKLTGDRSINILPRWSPDGKEIVYTSYKHGNPDLFIMNSNGSGKRPLSTYQGLNVPANFSHDGSMLAISMSRGKSPNIYLIDRDGRIKKQLTYGSSIDVSPCFSPNDKEIAFVSGRAGTPQMYVTDISGANTRRLTTDGYADSPSWSPKGNIISFAMRPPGRGVFDIYLFNISGQMYFPLTQGSGTNENPSFSPDGRYIVFSSNRNGKYELFIMFVDGSGQRKLAEMKGNSYCPSWGP